mmetsp:Transcript_14572/g.40497  ORF Transcript_14572/g.40497 Transcript_14572/m.40497 type:complete len:311 (-) Transcript_14572:966-1898(-)
MRLRTTTIRATTDIFHKSTGQQQLFPAAVLRVCDHHLHSSNIIPKINFHPDNASNRIYEHDWLCVSQAVRCYNAHATPPLLHRVVNGGDACYCDVWVDTDSIGKSSIHFGAVISVGWDILAVVRRIFVRMNRPDSHDTANGIGQKPNPAPFSDTEKERFCSHFGFEALKISENYRASDAETVKNLVDIQRPDMGSASLETMINNKGLEGTSVPAETRVGRVEVGPQHINFGNHADHAFLAETAFHALATSTELSSGYLSVQYLAEVFLGDVLESYAYRPNAKDSNHNSVILVASRKTTGERKVVLIAQSR